MSAFDNPTQKDIPQLVELIRSTSDESRRDAALALGTIGSAECIAPVLEALSDDDDYVRSYAMMGIKRGMNAHRCTREFLDAVFPALAKLLNRDDESVSGDAPELLLLIDSSKALPIMLSNDYFTTDNRELHYILRALNGSEHLIPHDKLLPLLNELKPLAVDYPFDYSYAEALIAYARNPDSSAEPLLRSEMHSTNETIQEAAAESLAIWSGISNSREVVFERLASDGLEALSEPQRLYYAVSVYDAEVNNGGHSQYFFNSSGDLWKSALKGLSEIGAVERAKILQEAINLFGSDGPSESRSQRQQQLHKLEQQGDVFEPLDDLYYSTDENVSVLLSLFAIKHKSHFDGISPQE